MKAPINVNLINTDLSMCTCFCPAMNANAETKQYNCLQIITPMGMDNFISRMRSCGGFPCGSPVGVQSSTGQNYLAVCAPQQAGATTVLSICCTPPPPPLPPWPPGTIFPPSPYSPPPTPPPSPSPPPPPPPAGYVTIYIKNPNITSEVQGDYAPSVTGGAQGDCIIAAVGAIVAVSGRTPIGTPQQRVDVQGGVIVQVNFISQADSNAFYTMVRRE